MCACCHSQQQLSLQSHSEVPLTLALGLTTTASALLSLLPSEITDRCMALRNFRLVRCAVHATPHVQGSSSSRPCLVLSRG